MKKKEEYPYLDKNYVKLLKERFTNRNAISTAELHDFFSELFPMLKKNSTGWIIYNYKEQGILVSISRGFYKIQSNSLNKPGYGVLIGDIKSSRKKIAVNEKTFEYIVNQIKKVFEENFKEKDMLELYYGDEIQFVSRFDENYFKKVLIILYYFKNEKLRYGITVDNTYELDNLSPINTNNSLYWNSRDLLLNEIKYKDNNRYINFGLLWSDEPTSRTYLFDMINIVIDSWTDKQWEAIMIMLLSKDIKNYAKENNITFQAVYDRLEKANYYKVINSLKQITIEIERGFNNDN